MYTSGLYINERKSRESVMQIENFTLKLSTLYSLLFILLKLTIKNLYFNSIFL